MSDQQPSDEQKPKQTGDGVTPWRDMPFVVKALAIAFIALHGLFMLAPLHIQYALLVTFGVYPPRFDPSSAFAYPSLLWAPGALFGHAFLHASWVHVILNTLMFMYVAPNVVRRLGSKGFLILFFASAAGGAMAYVLLNFGQDDTYAVGASGAISGLFAANILAASPDWRDALKDPTARRLTIMFLVFFVGVAWLMQAFNAYPIAWEAHLGGFIAGGLLYPVLARTQRQLDS